MRTAFLVVRPSRMIALAEGWARPAELLVVSVLMLVNLVLSIFGWIIIISAVLSWLITFNVVNTRNDFVMRVWDTLGRITEPVLRPVRAILPNLGGIDISPVVVLLAIWLLQDLNARYLIPMVARAGL